MIVFYISYRIINLKSNQTSWRWSASLTKMLQICFYLFSIFIALCNGMQLIKFCYSKLLTLESDLVHLDEHCYIYNILDLFHPMTVTVFVFLKRDSFSLNCRVLIIETDNNYKQDWKQPLLPPSLSTTQPTYVPTVHEPSPASSNEEVKYMPNQELCIPHLWFHKPDDVTCASACRIILPVSPKTLGTWTTALLVWYNKQYPA